MFILTREILIQIQVTGKYSCPAAQRSGRPSVRTRLTWRRRVEAGLPPHRRPHHLAMTNSPHAERDAKPCIILGEMKNHGRQPEQRENGHKGDGQ